MKMQPTLSGAFGYVFLISFLSLVWQVGGHPTYRKNAKELEFLKETENIANLDCNADLLTAVRSFFLFVGMTLFTVSLALQ